MSPDMTDLHTKYIDKRLSDMDVALVRQAMRGIGASVLNGFNEDKWAQAQNIAKATQKASLQITNKVAQDCGISAENQKALVNLVGQTCKNTRRCVIDNIDQENKMSRDIELCAQHITINNDALQQTKQDIEQLVWKPGINMKRTLMKTIVWSTVGVGALTALILWITAGIVPAVAVVILGAFVVFGVGMYVWWPSRGSVNQNAFLLYGSVKRSPGNITDSKYNPLQQCGVPPYRSEDVNSMSMASRWCRSDPACKSFYFATYDNTTDPPADCETRTEANCTKGCFWRDKKCGVDPTLDRTEENSEKYVQIQNFAEPNAVKIQIFPDVQAVVPRRIVIRM